jgi:hypothetical protein
MAKGSGMQIARRLVHALVIVLTLVIGAAAAAVIVSQTAWFKHWLRGYIVAQANQYLNGTLSIERLGGNLFFGFELENIALSLDGSQVVAVKNLGVDYNLFQMVARGLSIDSVRLDKPVIYLRREGDTWSLSRLVKKQEQEEERAAATPVSIDAIRISDGSIVVDGLVGTSGIEVPKRFDHLDAKAAFKYAPVSYSIEIMHLSFRGSEPEFALNALSGVISIRNDAVYFDKLSLRTAETSLSIDGAVQHYLAAPSFNMQISSDKVSLPEIARLVPALSGVRLQPTLQLKLEGPLDRLGVEMKTESSAGGLHAKVTADVQSPGQSVTGTLSVRHVDLAPLLADSAQTSDITADARIDVHGEALSNVNALRGTLALSSPRIVAAGYTAGPIEADAVIEGRRVALDAHATAYGAAASAAGQVTLPDMTKKDRDPIAFDVRGRASQVDLRNLPRDLKLPTADTNITADYHLAGSALPTNLRGDLHFLPSSVAGAEIAAGSTAGFTLSGKAIGYSADATVSNVDLQRIGEAFDVPALADERYKSVINAHVTADGRGTTPRDLDVTASGTVTDTALLGGQIPRLDFIATLAGDTAHVKANGMIAGFDPAVATGKAELKGTLGGHLDVDATIAGVSTGVTADSLQARANVTLDPSTIGGLEITRASIDGDYRDSTGEIRALEVVGRDLNVRASGTLALNDAGQSSLELHADSSSLAGIGKLVNQPLAGIAKVDATLTGNRRELQATGNLTASAVKYGDSGALSLSTDYTAKVPELNVADASVTATSHATFITVAGQNINEMDATTTYNQKQVDFEATVRQPARSATAAGSVALHPDHQEIHLRALAMTSQGVQWQTAPDSEAAIRYATDGIEVNNLKLVSGDQAVAADGAFGRPGDALQVTLNNIDVATIDALMLRAPQLSGRLNASGTIDGTKDAPRLKAGFKVEQGGFRQVMYDSFVGTVDYAGKGVTVDSRLQQNPTTWLTAKGYLPVALFKGATADSAPTPAGVSDAREDRIDFHVDSSPIDLGLVQGFTTAVTDVKGTLQAKLDVTGAADDPRPGGVITVQDGAFVVAATNVPYSNLNGLIELQADKVRIGAISLLDNRHNALNISGDLGIREREIGGVQIYLSADDFKVVDNKMGNVRLYSALQISGELRAPRIDGNLGITTGQISLDAILARLGDSAYATQQTEFVTGTPVTEAVAPASSPMDPLQMDVHFTVPNDLVVKANDLKAPGAPIGLGALTLTLGGDLFASKSPYDQVRLLGTVKTVRGTYDFQGRRFTILRDGTVKFDGGDEFNPLLDIRTERIIQAVTARVDVRGTLTQPEIVLSSTPPLEQGDVLALIVFNQPLNSLGEGQQISLAQRAQEMAAGAAAGALAQSIGNALNLDTFQINVAPENGGGPSLTLGQQVGQNLYVKVEQGIGDQSQTNFVVEYEISKWLRLQTNVLQGSGGQQNLFQRAKGSGVDLLFFFSY